MWIWSEWEGKTSQLHVLKSVPCLFCTVNVYAYSVTFCIANGTVTSLSSLVKVSFMKLLCWCKLLVQNPLLLDIALCHLCDGNSKTWRGRRNKNVAHPFWILNLWPGGLLWNTNSWIRSRRETREKCDDACVFYCCLCSLCPIYKHLSRE